MSSRSGLPRMWFSARAVSVNGNRAPRRLDGRGDPLDGVSELVDPAGRGRSPRSSRRRRPPPRPGDRVRRVLGRGAVAVLEVDRDREVGRLVERRTCARRPRRASTPPSRRPSVKAKPELVVASASKPSAARTRAEPASHGFGMTNGSPSWSALNAAALSNCVVSIPQSCAIGEPRRNCHTCER